MQADRRRLIAVLAAFPLCTLTPVNAMDVLNVGLVPAEDPRLVITDNQVLIDALKRGLGVDVKPFVATDYNGVIEALRAKKLDLALLGPFSYVLATTVADIEAFALPDTARQGATYRSIIIARKDRGYKTVADLKGKTFAFVDPGSASGHLFPKAGLIRGGMEPDTFFSHVMFSGGHDASALAVQNGKVDAAAVADSLLEMAVARGMLKREDIQILWTSGAIPGAPFVMRKDLPTELKQRIRKVFADMRDVPWGPKNSIKRWEPATDATYDVVRETAKVLKLDLRKHK